MRVAFRADASLHIGSGHVSRCLTLAEALREAGHDVMFISRELPGNMNARVRESGITVCNLTPPDPAQLNEDCPLAQLLGVSPEKDAIETQMALDSFEAHWMVADHYGIDIKWESLFRRGAVKLMVIDDLANRLHDCDILLDQNLFFAGAKRYQGLLPSHCELLIGPTYALLNRQYARKREAPLRDRSALRRLLLYFGGGDTAVPLTRALALLMEPEFVNIHVDVVANPMMAGLDDVKAAIVRHGNAVLHPPQPNLADMLDAADFAIGGGGASTWERMCLGVPAAVVVMAENQRLLASELEQRGLTINLGDLRTICWDRLREALRAARQPGQLAAMSARIRSICDGNGSVRTCAKLVR